MNSLDLYLKVSRLIFGSTETSYTQSFELLKELTQSLSCKFCGKLLENPCFDDKKQHFVCSECLGNNKPQYHLEKNNQIKLILNCYKDLCEYIKASWRESTSEECQDNVVEVEESKEDELMKIVDAGTKCGTSEKEEEIIQITETSSLTEEVPEVETIPESIDSLSAPVPSIQPVPLPQSSPILTSQDVQSIDTPPAAATPVPIQVPEIDQTPNIPQNSNMITLIPQPQIIQQPISLASNIISTIPQQIVQYQPSQPPPQVQQKKITINPGNISSSLTGKPLSTYLGTKAAMAAKTSTIAPIKITLPTNRISNPQNNETLPISSASPTRTIYSVMFTGSGNKITLKRRTTSDGIDSVAKEPKIMSPAHLNNAANIKKLDTTKTTNEFKKPIQIYTTPAPVPTTNTINQFQSKTMKRRGCRCGNATATPGKLTCCGQRCPCYVDSKACIDCKCRGCRNPHFVDGLKKMRHHVPDILQQQQQQQTYFASFQQPQQQQTSSTLATDLNAQSSHQPEFKIENNSSTSTILNTKSVFSNNSSSTNSCIINVSNNNGQYQIKQQSQSQTQTTSQVQPKPTSILYPTSSLQSPSLPKILPKIPTSAGIQIVGLYSSQMPMVSGNSLQKIIMKSESQTVTLGDMGTSAPMITTTSAGKFNLSSVNNFQHTNLITTTMVAPKTIPQQTFYLDESKKFIMIKQDAYTENSELDHKDVIVEEM